MAIVFKSSRRRLLAKGGMIAGGAVAVASGAFSVSAQTKKITQSAANYQPTPKDGAQCDACTLFEAPAACQSVEVVISPRGWCSLFATI
jgi:hypothetical protein